METYKNARKESGVHLTSKDIKRLTLSAGERKALRTRLIEYMENNPIADLAEEEVRE